MKKKVLNSVPFEAQPSLQYSYYHEEVLDNPRHRDRLGVRNSSFGGGVGDGSREKRKSQGRGEEGKTQLALK